MHHGGRTDPGRRTPRGADLLEDDDLEPTRLDWQLDGFEADELVTEPTDRFGSPGSFPTPGLSTEEVDDVGTTWRSRADIAGSPGWQDDPGDSMAPGHDIVRTAPVPPFGPDLAWDEETGEIELLAEAPPAPVPSPQPAPLRMGTIRPMDDLPEVQRPSTWSAGVDLPDVRARSPRRPVDLPREAYGRSGAGPDEAEPRGRPGPGVRRSRGASVADRVTRSHSAPSHVTAIRSDVTRSAQLQRQAVKMWLIALTLGSLAGTITLCAGAIALS